MELVRWAFGPNGVMPLFVRGGAKAEDEEADKKVWVGGGDIFEYFGVKV